MVIVTKVDYRAIVTQVKRTTGEIMAVPVIKLVTYKDPGPGVLIYYWVLIVRPTERIGPPYFTTKQDAYDWADQNGYKYK